MITPTTPSSSNPATVTLAEVKEQFTHWRATRSKLGKIPEVLWDSVRQLTKQHGYGQIASELGLSFQQLRSKLQDEYFDHQRSKRPDDDPVRTEFVAAEFPPLASYGFLPQTATLELSRSDGIALKAIGLGQQETLALLERFLG